jgi:RNA polymerase sigma factor (TIGR02999 family)
LIVPADRDSSKSVTALLLAWQGGNEAALNELMPLVYDELRRLADSYLRRERAGHTLQTTALVHEAYLRLVDVNQMQWESRAQFFGVAATFMRRMRRILVDHARARLAEKRGGGERLSLTEAAQLFAQPNLDLIALDDALTELAQFDRQGSRNVYAHVRCRSDARRRSKQPGVKPVSAG